MWTLEFYHCASNTPLPRKTEPLLVQEDEGDDTDVWIMDSEGTWMRVPNTEYLVAPILYALVPRPTRPPTDTEEAIAQAYACPIVEEETDSNDEAED